LWNGLTGERFDLELPEIDGFFWLQDSGQLGLLAHNINDVWLIELNTGQVSAYTLSDTQLGNLYRGDEPDPLLAFGSPQSESFRLLKWWEDVSSDGQFIVDINYENLTTSIIDQITGESFPLTDPDDEWFDVMAAWMPNKSYLGVLQSDAHLLMYYYSEGPRKIRIALYDVSTRQLINTIDDVFWVNWSPDGSKLLYQHPDNIWYSAPCVLEILTEENRCYFEARARHKAKANSSILIHNLEWSTDGTHFSYIMELISAIYMKRVRTVT
jgi:hypothetical protein